MAPIPESRNMGAFMDLYYHLAVPPLLSARPCTHIPSFASHRSPSLF